MNLRALGTFCFALRKTVAELAYAFTVGSALVLGLGAQSASAQYSQTNVVSNVPNQAIFTDTFLVNPWGMAFSSTSPTWVANEGSGLATIYSSSGPLGLVVTVPPPPGSPVGTAGTPTGIVFNTAAPSFGLGGGNAATFLFSTLNGQIAGWNGSLGTNALTMVDNSAFGAAYTGLAIGTSVAGSTLYAPNFNSGNIDVFDSSFNQIALPGNFTDPNLPSGYAPFNIQNLANQLFVTYAPQSGGQPVAGLGAGIVDIFDVDGNILRRLVTGGSLNDPYGLALAPADFGLFSADLLVGNHGDGTIFAFDPIIGTLIGQLNDTQGNPLIIPGLWALAFGNGNQFENNALLFTAGANGGANSLFGEIQVTPLPAALPLFAAGLGTLGLLGWRRKKKVAALAA